eukprot:TRINITY_DN12817_c6_g1_i1.p2 TRINITY_DN12817_c6_g1~~TRINITY_DN12817_c6_g1_i1.p2  ORF type:complete len:402 (-),score=119.23 TRINITY_DN12817_c6_g1_i1:644-1849(-)
MKATVVYGACVSCFVLFMLFSKAPPLDNENPRGRKLMRVKLHKTSVEHPKLEHIPFDPIVAEWEEKEEDRIWERTFQKQHHDEWLEMKQHEAEEHQPDEEVTIDEPDDAEWEQQEHELEHEADDYFRNDHFNITWRLTVLFPQIDSNPQDGLISVAELEDWHIKQGEKASMHRTGREIEASDRDHDGLITLKEYLHDHSPGDEVKTDWPDHEKEWVETATRTFPLADLDHDGKLNKTEFDAFLHPEDSDNPKLLQHLREEEIRERDQNHDGKLDFDEFHKTTYDELREWDIASEREENNTEVKLRKSQAKFLELDKNNDGYLTENELEPIMSKLEPGERHYAKQQTQHMIEQADKNHDSKLSLEEMIDNPYVFYNTAYQDEDDEEDNEDDDDDDYGHEDFR